MSNFSRIAEAGRVFACSIYKATPGALIPNPINDLLRLPWDALCGDGDVDFLPPPPTPLISGAQCECVAYNVRVNWTYDSDTSPGDQPVSRFQDAQLFGKIGGSRVVALSPFPDGSTRSDIQVMCQGFYGAKCTTPAFWVTVVSQVSGLISHNIQNRGRVDGGVDNCGSLPPTFPPSTPPPPNGYTSSPVSITYNDNTTFTAVFNLKPPVGDVVSPPPICLSVFIGNKTFEVCYPFGGVPTLGGGDDTERLLEELQRELREFKEQYDKDSRPLPPDEDPSLTPQPLDGDSGGEEDAEGIKWLSVVLTEFPSKAQFGNPTVFFAGWVTFRVNGSYTERQSISYERSLFRAPEGATGYGVTFTNFSKGNVVSYTAQQS